MRTAALLLTATALLTGCGVTAQDEPQPLVTSTVDQSPTTTGAAPTSTPFCRDAVGALVAEFSGRVSKGVVAHTVVGARHDLEGQTQPAALAGMLHRLARYRLDVLVSTST